MLTTTIPVKLPVLHGRLDQALSLFSAIATCPPQQQQQEMRMATDHDHNEATTTANAAASDHDDMATMQGGWWGFEMGQW